MHSKRQTTIFLRFMTRSLKRYVTLTTLSETLFYSQLYLEHYFAHATLVYTRYAIFHSLH